ncbi:hypothetical protein [Deinococcus sp. QL22]|uniref:hypothetical protein n=1 Tax=Deinococcus sp. QL22 TaxID=2939437 RepID=UPI002017250B|nr:hypothetical protein [Deinococcus sp. QL22]UQN08187.1 hypothetical protein M1R55_19085 [Deinococcus sp. QL22]
MGASLLSTDVLRAAVRHLISAQLTSHVHRSCFTVCTDAASELLNTIDHQTAAVLAPALQAALERALSGHPLVVEDVYLLKTHMPRVLMTTPTFPVDVERLQQRGRGTHRQRPAEPPTPYVNELRTVAPVLMAIARVQDSNGSVVLPWDEHTHAALFLLSLKCLTDVTSPPVKGLSGARGACCR